MILLDGKATATAMRAELAREIAGLTRKAGRPPGLTVVLAGEDPASQIYVRNKERACREAGVRSEVVRLPATVSQAELGELVRRLNREDAVDGVLVQLPLPRGLDEGVVIESIDPAKDVDGFHPVNVGRLAMGMDCLAPCTPAGIMVLLERFGLNPSGKKAVVVGRSNIVGRPLSLLLSAGGPMGDATVTLCHSRTRDLARECREADFLFVAVGKPGFITRDMVKPGAVVVDVGMNRTPEGLRGDCDFAGISEVAHAATPVPGGVGLMTIAMLLANTVRAFKARTGLG